MAETDAVLRTLGRFLGRDSDPETLHDDWEVSPFEQAFLVVPRVPARGAHLFLVQDETVQPVQLARMSLDEAYGHLRERLDG